MNLHEEEMVSPVSGALVSVTAQPQNAVSLVPQTLPYHRETENGRQALAISGFEIDLSEPSEVQTTLAHPGSNTEAFPHQHLDQVELVDEEVRCFHFHP